MKRIGVRELRQNASRYLALVKDGETVEVTERGELIAVLAPPGAARTTREELVASGRLIPAATASNRRRTWPIPMEDGGPSNQQLLDLIASDVGGPMLRTLDALHLGSAIVLGDTLTALVAYDHTLLDAAKVAGLATAAPGISAQAPRSVPN